MNKNNRTESTTIKLAIAIVAGLVAFSACSPLTVHRANKETGHLKERPLGTLSYYGDGDGNHVHLVKIKKGYALKGNMHDSGRTKSDIVLSKNKESKWFAGMQWSWKLDWLNRGGQLSH